MSELWRTRVLEALLVDAIGPRHDTLLHDAVHQKRDHDAGCASCQEAKVLRKSHVCAE